MKHTILLAGTAMFLLSGCINLQPDYKRPELAAPTSWPTGPAYRPAAYDPKKPSVADMGWDQFFSDEKLRKLIAIGIANNRDLRVAMLDVVKARAQYRVQRAEQLPTVNLEGQGDIQRIPRRTSSTGSAYTSHQYTAEVGVSSYELDLFGQSRA